MSADLITVSYTTRRGPDPEDGDAEAAIVAHLEAIRKDIEHIDGGGYFEACGYDEEIRDDFGTDMLLPTLMEGWQAHKSGYLLNQWSIPGTTKDEVLWFNVAGGTSYGDNPFDGFDALCMLIDAAALFPTLGERLGILGGGIVIPGRVVY